MKKYRLMEICITEDCTEYGGGWVVYSADHPGYLETLANENQSGCCPGCYRRLRYEIWDEEGKAVWSKELDRINMNSVDIF